jgi:hypothetical protein
LLKFGLEPADKTKADVRGHSVGGENEDKAIVCWHCGALVPLRVTVVDGSRVVICACGKTNSLETAPPPRSSGGR